MGYHRSVDDACPFGSSCRSAGPINRTIVMPWSLQGKFAMQPAGTVSQARTLTKDLAALRASSNCCRLHGHAVSWQSAS